MKAIQNLVFLGILLCSAFAIAQLKQGNCYFINAASGLNLREGPSVNHKVIQKLPYGAQLKIIDHVPSIGKTYVIDNGVKKYGQWVIVEPTFYDYLYEYERKMYVFDAFLAEHLVTMPLESLHNFEELVHVSAHDNYKIISGVSSRREMNRGGCDVRYEYNPAAKEALKKIIQFEVVNRDDYINQKIIGNYEIDAIWQPKKFKLEHDYRPVEWEQYYLPLKGRKDSVLIKDHTGEWASKTEYYGQIHELDSYLISGFAEDAEVIMVNRTTGKFTNLSSGLPEISPNGAYLISEYFNVFANTVQFTVREFDEETIPRDYFISFTSWIPAGGFFWISENEFVMGVLPMDTIFQNDRTQSTAAITYLKGSIQF